MRNDHWVFGDKGTGGHLLKFGWFTIHRHIMVKGTASPDDPTLREYWWARRKVNALHLDASDRRLGQNQNWVCPVCGLALMNGELLERHHWQPRSEGGSDAYSNRVLLHLFCHQQLTAAWRQARR
jgi:RNA-directed DNA polymerase